MFILLFVVLLSLPGQHVLKPGESLQREIATGESHPYPIKLATGPLIRVGAVQKNINLAIALADPDGKEILEVDYSGNYDGRESLSYEATQSGEYRIFFRALGTNVRKGTYEARLDVRDIASAEDRRRINAERLLLDSFKSQRQANYQAVIDKASQVLPLWRELADAYWEAETLSLLGSASNSTRKFEPAADYYNQSLVLRRQIKDRAGESNVLEDLSEVSRGQNNYDQSLAFATQALEIKRELKDRAGEGKVLYRVALAKSNQGKFTEVIAVGDEALAILEPLGDRTSIANIHNLKGNSLLSLGKLDEAIKSYEKSLALYRETKNRAGEANVLNNLALSANRIGDHERALDLYEKAIAIRREQKDRLNEGTNLRNIANVLSGMGEYEKAIERLNTGLSIARELKDPVGEVGALVVISSLYVKLGQYKEAIDASETARSIAVSLKNPGLLRNSYSNLEIIAFMQGQYEKAIEFEEQKVKLDRELQNRALEVQDLTILGGSYRRLGRYEKATEVLEQALVISREIKPKENEAYVLANIGLVYMAQAKYREAIPYHEQSMLIFRESKMPGFEARSVINLGECARKTGKIQESIELTNKALALAREARDRDAEGISHTNLGAALNASGEVVKAREHLTQALLIARELKSPSEQRDALNELVRLERNQGNLAKASEYLDQSLTTLESSRSEILNPQSRASFLAAEHEVLDLQIDLLMRRSHADPHAATMALEASERSRARVLLELLSEARVDIRQGVDAALVREEQELGSRLNTWAGRLEQAKQPALAARLKQELSQLETEYERAQSAVRKASPQYTALTQPSPLKLREIQELLDADTLLLEYALGEERSYVWAVTRDSMASYELPKGEAIKKSALEVYEALTVRSVTKRGETAAEKRDRIDRADRQLPGSAKTLSQILLGPVSSQIGSKRLVIVADGALQYIPFAMLPDPAKAGVSQPLIVNHEVVSLPSASALAIQRNQLAGRQPAPKMLAVVADPVFDRADKRFRTPPGDVNDNEQPHQPALNEVRSIEHLAKEADTKSGESAGRLVIPRLPYTRQEADQLMALASSSTAQSSFKAVDFQASRSTVLSGDLSQYRYVHFATHGLLDTERPGLSSLVLSRLDREGKPLDAFLRVNDIYNLKLPAELVVLSACQTGLGKEIKGEGLVGLTRGFMYAGAARVVVSLWNVNDKATAELMTKFYERMLKRGERPAAALRAAQVEIWNTKQWKSPYYWAPFTLQGEWR